MNFMKKLLGALAITGMLCSTAFASVAINATTFPNATFRSYVSTNFDSNSDGTLSDAEIAKARVVDIQGKGAMNLAGIENLTALRALACDYSLAGNEFNYTNFKAAYGLLCEIDDSCLLMMHIEDNGVDGLTTPMIGDIRDAAGVLKMPLYGSQTLNSISYRTKGTAAIEVHVAP